MGTKMKKGILKPLRYISSMFDSKEPEMQIGFPTDIKHVAHIGWDGPNVNAPSWMKEFHSAPLTSTSFNGGEGRESPMTSLWGSQEFMRVEDSPAQPTGLASRLSSSSVENSVTDSPNNIPVPNRPRHSRRNQSDGTAASDSPNRDPSDGGSRRSRRVRKKEGTNATDSPVQDLPAIPKQSHRRKPKGSVGSSGGSTRSSRAKASMSLPAPDAVHEESIVKPMPKLESTPEEEEEL